MGTHHTQNLDDLNWGPTLEDELKRFNASSAFFDNNDVEMTFKIAKIFQDLKVDVDAMVDHKMSGDNEQFNILWTEFQKKVADPTLQAWLNVKYEKSGSPLTPDKWEKFGDPFGAV